MKDISAAFRNRFPVPADADAVRRTSGFTLVELLVVLAIVALMVALLLPSLKEAREIAMTVKCLANIRQVGTASYSYSQDSAQYLLSSSFFFRHDLEKGQIVWPGQTYGKWLDVMYVNYMNSSIGALECPMQNTQDVGPGLIAGPTIVPTKLGFMVNRQVRRWFGTGGYADPADTGFFPRYAMKVHDFQKPSEKIWYADAGTRWSNPLAEALPSYGTHSRFTQGANDNNNTGLSRRHFDGSNILLFDGHGRTAKYDEVGVQTHPSDSGSIANGSWDKHKKYWSPIGKQYDHTP